MVELLEKEVEVRAEHIPDVTMEDVRFVDESVVATGFEKGESYGAKHDEGQDWWFPYFSDNYGKIDFIARKIGCEDYILRLRFNSVIAKQREIADRIKTRSNLEYLAEQIYLHEA